MLGCGSLKKSLGDFADLSDGALALTVDRWPGDFGALLELKNGERAKSPGLMGDVAVGRKNGSTTGFVTAVCSAVRNRLGPAGFGMTITSGMRVAGMPFVGARMV